MPTIPDFTPKTPILRTYQGFAGVDFTSDATNVQINRSPDSVNMYKDYKSELGQAIESRPGFSNLVSLDYPIYGIHFFKKDSLSVLVHAGNKMFLWKNYPSSATEEDMELLYSEMNEIKSRSFVYGDILYINDGKNYLYYDGSKFGRVKDIAYIPTTTIAKSPTGGGETLNPVNLLQPKRRNSFLADGTSKNFTLDAGNIDDTEVEVTVDGVAKKEGTDFTVNRMTGTIIFNSAPPAPGTIGQDNVIITFSKTVQDYDNRIEKCTLSCIFDNRIFYSGNEDYPNALFNSMVNDPTYIADINYYQDGSDNVPITSLLRVGDSLMVIKSDDQQDAVVYYHTPSQVQIDEDTTNVTYPTKQGLAGIGCISEWGSTNFLDEPVFISRLGLESFTKLNLGLERSIEHKSSTVDGKLVNEVDLQNVHLEEWNGYLLCLINGHIYLADNRQKYENKNTGQVEYEWYYWDNIGDFIKKTEPKPFEGDSVFLEDTSNKKIRNLSLVGRSKQATRSGKNKLDVTKMLQVGQVTNIDSKTGSFTVSRAWATKIMEAEEVSKLLKPSTQYKIISDVTLVSKPTELSNTGSAQLISLYRRSPGLLVDLLFCSNKDEKDNWSVGTVKHIENTFTTPDDLENFSLIAYNYLTEDSIEGSFKFENTMIKEATETNEDFEQYGAIPSTEFPSEIKNTGDNINLLKNVWKKCVISSGYPIELNDSDNTITITSKDTKVLRFSSTTDYRGIMSDFVAVKKGEDFTINFESCEGINRFYVEQYDTNKQRMGALKTDTTTLQETTITANEDGYIVVGFANTSASNNMTINKVKLEKGSGTTAYSSYNCGNTKVTVCNKNFFDLKKVENLAMATPVITENQNYRGYSLRVRPSEQYTISRKNIDKNNRFRVCFTEEKPANNVVMYGSTWEQGDYVEASHLTEITVTVPTKAKYLFLYLSNENENITEELQIQIEKSSNRSEHAQHEEQSITFPLSKNQRMCEGDYLAGDGIHSSRTQDILDGTETISIFTYGTHVNTTIFKISKNITKKDNVIKFCSHFKVLDNTVATLNKDENWIMNDSNGTVYVCIENTIANTVETFKEWLTEQKVVIEYELAEETVEEYTEEQQQAYNAMQNIKTYEDGTNIFADNADVKGTYESIINGYDFKKATLLKEFDGRLLFGTENGTIAEFKMYQYNDNGRAIICKWTTPADNFKSANHVKTTNKRGGIAYLKTFPNSVCKLNVKTDKTDEREIARYVASGFSFRNFSFKDFSFTTTPKSFMQYKIKEKKWMNIQLIFYSDELDKPFGIFMATLEGFIGGYKKGGY